MRGLLREKTYQKALSKISSPLDPCYELRELKYEMSLLLSAWFFYYVFCLKMAVVIAFHQIGFHLSVKSSNPSNIFSRTRLV